MFRSYIWLRNFFDKLGFDMMVEEEDLVMGKSVSGQANKDRFNKMRQYTRFKETSMREYYL